MRRSSEQMRRLLEDYRSSGLIHKGFAESRKVPLSTLTNWLRRMRSSVGADSPDSPVGGFVEAEASVAPGCSREALGNSHEHVEFELECIDRMYLNLYIPGLQTPEFVAHFIKTHLGKRFASSAVLAPISDDFVTAIKTFLAQSGFRNAID